MEPRGLGHAENPTERPGTEQSTKQGITGTLSLQPERTLKKPGKAGRGGARL